MVEHRAETERVETIASRSVASGLGLLRPVPSEGSKTQLPAGKIWLRLSCKSALPPLGAREVTNSGIVLALAEIAA